MITVNGKQTAWAAGTTVASLLKNAGFVFPLLIVRVNGALVDRARRLLAQVLDDRRVVGHHLHRAVEELRGVEARRGVAVRERVGRSVAAIEG